MSASASSTPQVDPRMLTLTLRPQRRSTLITSVDGATLFRGVSTSTGTSLA